jgi:hypothetical protein
VYHQLARWLLTNGLGVGIDEAWLSIGEALG